MNHTIIECETAPHIDAACILLRQMYPDAPEGYVRNGTKEMRKEGWRMIGIFAEDGSCKATISYRIGTRLFFGKLMQLDSLFIDPQYRRQKLAEALFNWTEKKAAIEECGNIILESTSENTTGHQFFFKQGYFIRGFVLIKPLSK